MKSINAPVYDISGKLLLPAEEKLPPTAWDSFADDLLRLSQAGNPFEQVIEYFKENYKLEKHEMGNKTR